MNRLLEHNVAHHAPGTATRCPVMYMRQPAQNQNEVTWEMHQNEFTKSGVGWDNIGPAVRTRMEAIADGLVHPKLFDAEVLMINIYDPEANSMTPVLDLPGSVETFDSSEGREIPGNEQHNRQINALLRENCGVGSGVIVVWEHSENRPKGELQAAVNEYGKLVKDRAVNFDTMFVLNKFDKLIGSGADAMMHHSQFIEPFSDFKKYKHNACITMFNDQATTDESEQSIFNENMPSIPQLQGRTGVAAVRKHIEETWNKLFKSWITNLIELLSEKIEQDKLKEANMTEQFAKAEVTPAAFLEWVRKYHKNDMMHISFRVMRSFDEEVKSLAEWIEQEIDLPLENRLYGHGGLDKYVNYKDPNVPSACV